MAKKKPAFSRSDFATAARQALTGDASISPLGSIKSFVSGGIRMPLAMQYLFDIRAWPLGILIQLTGEQGSRKTSFLFHVGSWFNDLGGATDLTLTEGKLSESLIYANCGYPDEIVDENGNVLAYPVVVRISENASEWQRDITKQVDMFNGMMDKGWSDKQGNKVPPGIYAPFLFGVDSLVAQLTQEQTEAVEKQGGQDRGYATHVKALSQWISAIQSKITCRPYSMLLINHCTVTRPTEFMEIIEPKGGKKLAYECSLILFLSRNKMQTVAVDKPGFRVEGKLTYIKMKLLKSSVGDDTRTITVPLLDEFEICGEGETRQRTTFWWGEALVGIVMSMCYKDFHDSKISGDADSERVRSAYRKRFFDISPIKRLNGDKYECSKYQEGPMDAQTLGMYLEGDHEFVMAFYECTGIKPYDVWEAGTNYATFIEQLKDKQYADRVKLVKQD